MRFFGRTAAGRRRAACERRVPSFREMHARLRTERAEARLPATEVRIHREIHREAARIRDELRSST
jgi:hypothetical protein